MQIFVEVHNPTGQVLDLSRIEYQLEADAWFATAGETQVSRTIAAGTSAVIELEVPVDTSESAPQSVVPYVLTARLFARGNRSKKTWDLQAQGALEQGPNGPMQLVSRRTP